MSRSPAEAEDKVPYLPSTGGHKHYAAKSHTLGNGVLMSTVRVRLMNLSLSRIKPKDGISYRTAHVQTNHGNKPRDRVSLSVHTVIG